MSGVSFISHREPAGGYYYRSERAANTVFAANVAASGKNVTFWGSRRDCRCFSNVALVVPAFPTWKTRRFTILD